MSVKMEANGRRSVQLDIELPGTPEEVWQAIASGPGISSWFVPTEIVEQDGKPVAIKTNFGQEYESRLELTEWDPPRMFCGQGEGWMEGSPPLASEWHVEARGGGVCMVRIVYSLFASTDDWDNQIESAIGAMAGFLGILRLYLTHFRGQRSAIMQVTAPVASSEAESWDKLTSLLGIKSLSVGERWTTPDGPSPFGGVVEYLTEDPYDALLRLDSPSPGIVALGATTYPDGQGMVAMNLYAYGDQAAETVALETPLWEAWFQQHFPLSGDPDQSE